MRRYSSALRDESARQTRQAITGAAAVLFVRDGYAATSLASIALEAGCARPTVFAAFGSKSALLRQVLDEALAGDDEPVPVAERPWFQPVWEAQSVTDLAFAYADVCVTIARRAAPVFEVVRRAVDADHEVRDLWDDLVRNRRAGAGMVVRRSRQITGSRGKTDRIVDQVWFGNDPAHYSALVTACGWTERTYRYWLGELFTSALGQGPASAASPTARHPRTGAR